MGDQVPNQPSEPLQETVSESEELRMLLQSQPTLPEVVVVEEVEDSEFSSLSITIIDKPILSFCLSFDFTLECILNDRANTPIFVPIDQRKTYAHFSIKMYQYHK